MSGSGKARRVLMLKVIFLRPGNMVVLCLIEKKSEFDFGFRSKF